MVFIYTTINVSFKDSLTCFMSMSLCAIRQPPLAVYFMKLLIIIFLSCKNIVMCAACRWPGHGACHSSCCLHFLTLFSGCAAALVRCGSHDAQSVYWKSGLFIAAAATHLAWHAPVSTRPGPVRTQQSGTTSLSPADIEYCVLILLHLNCDVNPTVWTNTCTCLLSQ